MQYSTGAVREYCAASGRTDPPLSEWMDAYFTGVCGVVRIKDPGCNDTGDFHRWYTLLNEGTFVTIRAPLRRRGRMCRYAGCSAPRMKKVLTARTYRRTTF